MTLHRSKFYLAQFLPNSFVIQESHAQQLKDVAASSANVHSLAAEKETAEKDRALWVNEPYCYNLKREETNAFTYKQCAFLYVGCRKRRFSFKLRRVVRRERGHLSATR